MIRFPNIRNRDRVFWVFLSRFWKHWKRRVGRPSIDPEIRKLIRDMASANPLWGAPRIHGELMEIGIDVHERTISKIIKKFRPQKPPSQIWKTFLENHMLNKTASRKEGDAQPKPLIFKQINIISFIYSLYCSIILLNTHP